MQMAKIFELLMPKKKKKIQGLLAQNKQNLKTIYYYR